jgi:hypothetical protein
MEYLRLKTGSILIGEVVKRFATMNIIQSGFGDMMFYLPTEEKHDVENEFGIIIKNKDVVQNHFSNGDGIETLCGTIDRILNDGLVKDAFDVILDGDKTDAELIQESGVKDITKDEANSLAESMRKAYQDKQKDKEKMISECEEDFENLKHTLLYYSFDDLNKTLMEFLELNHKDPKLPLCLNSLLKTQKDVG